MNTIDDDPIIIALQDGLKKVLDTQTWAADFISQWCLTKLIKASKDTPNWDFKEACNFWLRCQVIRFSLDIVGNCYHKFNELEKDLFMTSLLKLFSDNRPRFDWCVAYLASLSPGKFLSIIRAPEMFTPILIPHTVAFIEHLSLMKSQSLNNLLKELIEGCLDSDQLDPGKHYTVECVSNLILVSFHSELYAQVLIEVFLEAVENKVNHTIERLKQNFEAQRSGLNFESFQKMIPELITRAKQHGTKLLLIFAEKITGEESNSWLNEMLEVVLTCLQMHATKMTSCPLMDELKKDTTWTLLWKSCLSDNHIVQQTAVRLILISTNEKHSLLYSKTTEKLLSTDSVAGFSALVKILEPPLTISDVPEMTRTFAHILQMLSIDVNSRESGNRSYYMLKNILALLNLEKNQFQHFKNARIKMALQTNANHLINIWSSLLKNLLSEVEHYKIQKDHSCTKRMKLEVEDLDEMEIAEFEEEKKYFTKDHNILITKIIDYISPIVSMNMSDLIKCSKLTVKHFFWCLIDDDAETRMSNLNHCYSLLNKQCYNKKTIRSVVLRDLLEGALFLYPNLFGAPDHDKNNQLTNNRSDSLLKYNQRKGISLNISKSSMLHAGVIGFGLQKIKENWSPDGLDEEMKNFFIKAILSCCSPMEDSTSVNANKIVMDGLCQLSHLLVELVSNDILYNGIIWPEEEFKTTIERDLHVRRTFKNCPILWPLMGLLATYRQPLYNCSVFLKAICASVIHHWQARSTENASGNNTELYFFTVKLLEILSLGQMLPHPLTYLHQVIEYLQPNEIAYVMRECVWNFMAVNGGISNETSETNGNKKSICVSDQFVDPLRNTMQKKLNILGNLYHQMFIAGGQYC